MLVYLIVKTFDFLMTVPHCIMWLYKFMPYLHLKKMEKLCLLTSAIFFFFMPEFDRIFEGLLGFRLR